jgi:hypothetical protein
LLYDEQNPSPGPKLVLVYDLSVAGAWKTLNLRGTCPGVDTPNEHETFYAGYVPLSADSLFIVGGPFNKWCLSGTQLVPVTER